MTSACSKPLPRHRGPAASRWAMLLGFVRLFRQILGEAVFVHQHRRIRPPWRHPDPARGSAPRIRPRWPPAPLRRSAGRRGSYCGHRVAVVEHLVPGHDVLGQIGHVAAAFARRSRRGRASGKSAPVRRRHTHRAWLSAADVDALDAGVGMGAAQDLAVDHPGQVEVSAVLRAAGDLVDPVRSDGRVPMTLKSTASATGCRLSCSRLLSCASSAAASCTARTILS